MNFSLAYQKMMMLVKNYFCSLKKSIKTTTTHLPGWPDHAFTQLAELLSRQVLEDVAILGLQDLKGDGAVMVLQGRDVIVAQSELRAGVDLIGIVVARVVEVVADGRGQQDEDVQRLQFGRKVDQPDQTVHLHDTDQRQSTYCYQNFCAWLLFYFYGEGNSQTASPASLVPC